MFPLPSCPFPRFNLTPSFLTPLLTPPAWGPPRAAVWIPAPAWAPQDPWGTLCLGAGSTFSLLLLLAGPVPRPSQRSALSSVAPAGPPPAPLTGPAVPCPGAVGTGRVRHGAAPGLSSQSPPCGRPADTTLPRRPNTFGNYVMLSFFAWNEHVKIGIIAGCDRASVYQG